MFSLSNRGIAKRPNHNKQPTPRIAYISSPLPGGYSKHRRFYDCFSYGLNFGEFLLRIKQKSFQNKM